ncbi:rhomboid-related protein 2-like [Clavelina lepadiformis]|uniref:rhomboid-related protein 2-like n=1 Tax=Clavelina lepadiformis TaxID=159417 RepID=UPI00404367CC
MTDNKGFTGDAPTTLKEIFMVHADGENTRIPVSRFRDIMEEERSKLSDETIQKLTYYMDKNNDGFITLEEINKLEKEDARTVAKGAGVQLEAISSFRRGIDVVGKYYLTKEQQKLMYSDQYDCCPPPIGIVLLSLAQIAVYIYYSATSGEWVWISPGVVTSPLTFLPDRRQEAWRFLTYMLVHAGVEHVAFNVIVQLVLGVPLEMVHGPFRVVGIYLGGVIAGSLATSIVDPNVILVGGSGGVYALMTAQIANVVLNGDVMSACSRVIRVVVVLILLLVDFGYAVYRRFENTVSSVNVAFAAHVAGAVAGVTLGLVLLKNFKQSLSDKVFFWIAIIAYFAFVIFAVFWNIFYPEYPPTTYG